MKMIFRINFSFLFSHIYIAQPFLLNQGGTTHKNYFSVISHENLMSEIIVTTVINRNEYRFILNTGAPNIFHYVFDGFKNKSPPLSYDLLIFNIIINFKSYRNETNPYFSIGHYFQYIEIANTR